MTDNSTPKKPVPEDWHPADIKAALDKAGWSFRQLGAHYGYLTNSLTDVLRKPWPKAERIVAAAIGVKPQTIWPSRYNADGTPNRPMGRPLKRPAHIKPVQRSTATSRGNPQTKSRD